MLAMTQKCDLGHPISACCDPASDTAGRSALGRIGRSVTSYAAGDRRRDGDMREGLGSIVTFGLAPKSSRRRDDDAMAHRFSQQPFQCCRVGRRRSPHRQGTSPVASRWPIPSRRRSRRRVDDRSAWSVTDVRQHGMPALRGGLLVAGHDLCVVTFRHACLSCQQSSTSIPSGSTKRTLDIIGNSVTDPSDAPSPTSRSRRQSKASHDAALMPMWSRRPRWNIACPEPTWAAVEALEGVEERGRSKANHRVTLIAVPTSNDARAESPLVELLEPVEVGGHSCNMVDARQEPIARLANRCRLLGVFVVAVMVPPSTSSTVSLYRI